MSVGLHILYGVMGAGKTNYAVNELLGKTTYKRCICNVPLSEDFISSHPLIKFEIKDKYSPQDVISQITSDNPSTIFIVDESQLVLTSLNTSACKSFAKKMSQIRQDDQDVILIAQTSKMLPSIIKEVATDCYKFENQNNKGLKGLSRVQCFVGGYDYSTKLLNTFTYKQVFGNYSTSNWESTEKPKNLFKGTYIKLGICIVFALFLLSFVAYKVSGIKSRYMEPEQKKVVSSGLSGVVSVPLNSGSFASSSSGSFPTFGSSCVRSFTEQNSVFHLITNEGLIYAVGLTDFLSIPRCPLN